MTEEEFSYAINLLSNGNKEGLRLIYSAYIKLIYAVIYDVVNQKEEAEDITSDFFIKLIRVSGSFRPGYGHRTWLVTIARNMAIDSIRKTGRTVLIDPLEDETIYKKQGEEEASIIALDISEAMKTLKSSEKEIVDMKLIGGLTFKEITSIVNKPMGTVTWLYNQGIIKLRRCLKEYDR